MTTHDYTSPRWGHDIVISRYDEDGDSLVVNGWGVGIKKGDTILLRGRGGNGSNEYQVKEVSYYPDPPDMFRAKLSLKEETEE